MECFLVVAYGCLRSLLVLGVLGVLGVWCFCFGGLVMFACGFRSSVGLV